MISESTVQILDGLDLETVNNTARQLNALPAGETFGGVVLKIISGELELSFSELLKSLAAPLFSELGMFSALLKEMVVIAILSAVLSVISLSLRNKAVADLGFYVVYIIIVALLLDSFMECVAVMRSFAGNLARFVEASVPLMASLLLVSGNPSSAAVLNPLAMFAAGAVQFIIRDIIGPVLIFAAVLEIVNNLSAREMLSRLSEIIKKGVKITLAALGGLFAAILTLYRISTPIVDGAAIRAARYAAGAVPVVGQALSSAVDAAVFWSGAVKNSVLIAVIIVILLICMPAIIKTAAFAIVYKITAALIEPICDKRAVNAINAAGSLASLALAACALAAASFIFMVMIMISL
ncbi:MAG: stage III sporulation protein AE [Defluviitaleaceae bacterium]|nr:stage III sporulation protein AE [Defluviitaleaceae bacterium]